MPRCPSCSKILPSDSAILRHMNQPTSRCHGWVDNLVEIGELLEQEPGQATRNGLALAPGPSPEVAQTLDSPITVPRSFENLEDETEEAQPEDTYQGNVEEFPGAASVFAHQANTFLQHFDRDQFSQERRCNLYYPFRSRADWDFGLWLTRSGLSMAAIDSFLSLELVSNPSTYSI